MVKVRPSICSGLAKPLATSQSTLTASSSVLPLPAPATTSDGTSSLDCSMAAIFSGAKSKSLITPNISAAEYLAAPLVGMAHRPS